MRFVHSTQVSSPVGITRDIPCESGAPPLALGPPIDGAYPPSPVPQRDTIQRGCAGDRASLRGTRLDAGFVHGTFQYSLDRDDPSQRPPVDQYKYIPVDGRGMSYECITYEDADGVATIHLDRPDELNALTPTLLDELEDALSRAGATDDVRVVVLAGNGRAFSAGYDIGEDEAERGTVDERMRNPRTHLDAIFDLRLPVIAAVDGHALAGGCNLAIACDLTFATERSEFGYPDMHFGEPPPKFVMPFVANSLKYARELLYTGKTIPAADAARMGLLNHVTPNDGLMEAVSAEIDHIKKTPGVVVELTKEMINEVQADTGYRRGRTDEYLALLTMETETPNRFREIRDEEGWEAALEWMHETDKP